MTDGIRYVSGPLARVTPHYVRWTDRDHIGVVEYVYGPYDKWSRVRTLCGLRGRMGGRRTPQPAALTLTSYACRTCSRLADRLEGQ